MVLIERGIFFFSCKQWSDILFVGVVCRKQFLRPLLFYFGMRLFFVCVWLICGQQGEGTCMVVLVNEKGE